MILVFSHAFCLNCPVWCVRGKLSQQEELPKLCIGSVGKRSASIEVAGKQNRADSLGERFEYLQVVV